MTRIVIAGGTGFLGRHLARAWLEDDAEVLVLTRRRGVPGPVSYVEWDGVSDGDWSKCLAGADAVVNLCGEGIGGPRWSPARKQTIAASRIGPGQTLVRAIAALDDKPKLLLQASGVGYYGPGEAVRTEADGPGDDFLADLAARWEASTAAAGIPRAVVRLGVVLARDGGALGQMLLPFRLFAGGPIASGRQWLSWVHVADAVRAIRFVAEQGVEGAVNVTAPEAVRNVEFARTAGSVMHRPALLRTPGFVLRAVLGEQAVLVCEGQNVAPAVLRERGFEFAYPTLRAALEEILN